MHARYIPVLGWLCAQERVWRMRITAAEWEELRPELEGQGLDYAALRDATDGEPLVAVFAESRKLVDTPAQWSGYCAAAVFYAFVGKCSQRVHLSERLAMGVSNFENQGLAGPEPWTPPPS